MASPNVDKMLDTMMSNPILVAELHLAFAKIEYTSGVDASDSEKIELLKEIAGTATTEPSITFKW